MIEQQMTEMEQDYIKAVALRERIHRDLTFTMEEVRTINALVELMRVKLSEERGKDHAR